ncbi:MAG: ubiquitin-like domain-containing protein [Anaerolineaceae bacterium]
MNSKTLFTLAIGSFLLGMLFCALMLLQPVILTTNGETTSVPAYGLTSGALLKHQGVEVKSGDRVRPPTWLPLLLTRAITLTTSAQVDIFNDQALVSFSSTERRPANLLQQADIRLFPHDSLLADGMPVDSDILLPPSARHVLQYHAAQLVTYTDGSSSLSFYSSAETVGKALWEQGIRLSPGDSLTPDITSLISGPVTVSLRHGRELTIINGGKTLKINSNAITVGGALQDAGLIPQGLDYCQPAEDQPLPVDGIIHLVRVREEVLLNQTPLPNTIEYQADINTELDQQSVIDAGKYGLEVQRIKIRYEDGRETSRQTEGQWTVKAPRPRIIGYGTKVVIRTVQVDGNTIEYWRSITVYATSYSPCNSGVSECLHKTANGMTVEKGVVGVLRSWYNLMNGLRIYVPGYGNAVIADIGAGFAGKDWIDLGYSDSDYVPWHSNVTIYFLTPVPTNIPWILP